VTPKQPDLEPNQFLAALELGKEGQCRDPSDDDINLRSPHYYRMRPSLEVPGTMQNLPLGSVANLPTSKPEDSEWETAITVLSEAWPSTLVDVDGSAEGGLFWPPKQAATKQFASPHSPHAMSGKPSESRERETHRGRTMAGRKKSIQSTYAVSTNKVVPATPSRRPTFWARQSS
jgi:hypothetical protein